MKNFIKTILAVIVGITVFSVIVFLFFITLVSILSSKEKAIKIEENTIFVLDFKNPISDRDIKNFDFNTLNFSDISNQIDGTRTITENIEKAAKDDNIKGIYLKINSIQTGIANLKEIRNALVEFKKSGKFIVASADSYGQAEYYLASVADSIYLTPTGLVELKGLASQVMFYKNALDKFGINAQVIRHGKYKSAVEPFMTDKMSEANREQITAYISAVWKEMLNDIANSRKISVDSLDYWADKYALFSDDEAINLGLITEAAYSDKVNKILKQLTNTADNDKLKTVNLKSYKTVPKFKISKNNRLPRNRIAVIYALGNILMGEGSTTQIGSENIAKAIRKARKDSSVKAIVMRVNSPGGSALASEIILHEVDSARKVKPFVISMGDYAASGGYYISCMADKIVAQPVSLTGSIGVLGVLFEVSDIMENKIGINVETVKTNKHADMTTIFRPLDNEEKQLYVNTIEEVYTEFVTHVSKGRNMTFAQVDSIGQGRIWSGIDALNIGLVDTLGGLNTALKIAADMAGIEKYRILELPEEKEPFDDLLDQLLQTSTKKIIKNTELGFLEKYYEDINIMVEQKGIQARLPYYIYIN